MSPSTLRSTRVLLPLIAVAALIGNASTQPTGLPLQPHVQTLLANDPLRHTLSLATGEHGAVVQNYMIKNFDSELDFGAYFAGGFTAGVQGGQVGTVLDLGTQLQLAAQYGFEETVGLGQGFASIHLQGGRVMIRKDLTADTFQSFSEGNDLLHAPVPQSSVGIPAMTNHVYLIRIVNQQNGNLIRFAKLLVTSANSDRVELVFQDLLRG